MVEAKPPIEPAAPPSAGEELRITHERGPMTRQVHSAALAQGGEALWQQLLVQVTPPCRERFSRPIGYFEWVESELALELHEAWSRLLGQDTMAQRGREAAQEILRGPQGWLLRLATPSLLAQSLPRLYGLYYRGGRITLDRSGAGYAEASLWATGYFDSWFEVALPAWAAEAFHLAGAWDPGVTALPVDPLEPARHRYHIRWKA